MAFFAMTRHRIASPARIFVFRLAKRKDMSSYIERAANQIADVLMREGLDYTQTKAVFKQARSKGKPRLPGTPDT